MKTVTLPTTWYTEACLQCGQEITAPSPRRLAYLLKAHKAFKHEAGPEEIPDLEGEAQE